MVQRGKKKGAFFTFEGGQLLKWERFVGEVRKVLTKLGLDYSSYAEHSFRVIRAVTTAAMELACTVWGPQWSGKIVTFHCDNTAAVAVVNSV